MCSKQSAKDVRRLIRRHQVADCSIEKDGICSPHKRSFQRQHTEGIREIGRSFSCQTFTQSSVLPHLVAKQHLFIFLPHKKKSWFFLDNTQPRSAATCACTDSIQQRGTDSFHLRHQCQHHTTPSDTTRVVHLGNHPTLVVSDRRRKGWGNAVHTHCVSFDPPSQHAMFHTKHDMNPINGHRAGGAPGGGSTPSGCCSPTACGRPPAACRRRSDAAGQEGCPPCPGSSASR
ncbi:unnamed protein product, partial [Ectocarpus sp. 12 AP-2014]